MHFRFNRVDPKPTRRALLTSSAQLATLAAFIASPLMTLRSAMATSHTAAAERLIENLGDEVLSVLNRPGLTESEAIAEFSRLFRLGFDIPTIARFVLGRYWNVATPEQRRDYVDLFESMIIETYARRFDDYSGERFQIAGVREETESDTIVITDVLQPGNPEAVQVAWRLRHRDTGPQIIDVIIEGVSMGVTQRQEFASVIERAGGDINALLSRMREQVDRARR
jgi:phospholipid transport system substrate-binding protein